MSLQKFPTELENWIEDMLYPSSSTNSNPSCSQMHSQDIKEGIEEIRLKGVESLDEYTVVTEIRREDSITAALQRISSFTASWPAADSSGIHAFYGHVDFDVSFDQATRRAKKKIEYSKKLNKLFVDFNHWFPINIQIKEKGITSLPQGTILRITPYFVEGEHSHLDVKACAIHQKDEHPHLIRCKNKNVKYTVENGDISRYSLELPFSGKSSTETLLFLCYSSCHELKRKKMEVLFTLEVAGRVVGRNSIEVKICSYPGRDIKQEEDKMKALEEPEQSDEKQIGKKEKKKEVEGEKANEKEIVKEKGKDKSKEIKEEKITRGSSTSTEVVLHQNKNDNITELTKQSSIFSAPPPPNPNQIYTVKVQGYENYRIICKILSGMEALKAIKNEVNASVAVAQDSQYGLKREGSLIEESDERKKARLSNGEDSQNSLVSTQPSDSTPLYQWLEALKLTQYLNNFVSQGYEDLDVIKELDMNDFQQLNIQLPGHVKKLYLAAKKLKELDNPQKFSNEKFEQIEQIEHFEKRTIMRRYHSALQ